MRSVIIILILSLFYVPGFAQVKSDVLGISMGISRTPSPEYVKKNISIGGSGGAYYEHYFNQWYGIGTGIFYTRTSDLFIQDPSPYSFFGPYMIRVDERSQFFQVDFIEIPVELYFRLAGRNGKTSSWYFVPGYSYGLANQAVFFEEEGFYNVSKKEALEFGNHNIHTIRFGTKVDFNIKNSMSLTLGANLNFMLHYYKSYYNSGGMNYQFFIRFGKLFMKKA